jgi:hypothetical protein
MIKKYKKMTEYKKFENSWIQSMQILAKDLKKEPKLYRVYYSDSNVYEGVRLDRLRFRASNKYELWIKIHTYMCEHIQGYSHIHTLYHRYVMNDHLNDKMGMINTIQDEIDEWENGNTLWWEEDDTEYI